MRDFTKQTLGKLEVIYSLYPRKMGKSQGFKSALAQCKKPGDLELLEKAVTNYMAYLIKEGTEKQYVLYFSTFMNQWRDWLEKDTGTVTEVKLDLSGIKFE